MKTYISKGTGIGMESKMVKIDPVTKEPVRGQCRESRFIRVEGKKYWSSHAEEINSFYADVSFIFNFPQRKINKALKENP